MASVRETIDVDVPVSVAYSQWTQFEDFPTFMDGVEEVRQLDSRHLHWKAQIAGRTKEWTAEIIEQVPDKRIAWRSASGTENSGSVSFDPEDQSRTRVTVEFEAEPDGAVESAGEAIGLLERRVKADLERFKEFIEGRGREIGASRGEVDGPNDR